MACAKSRLEVIALGIILFAIYGIMGNVCAAMRSTTVTYLSHPARLGICRWIRFLLVPLDVALASRASYMLTFVGNVTFSIFRGVHVILILPEIANNSVDSLHVITYDKYILGLHASLAPILILKTMQHATQKHVCHSMFAE